METVSLNNIVDNNDDKEDTIEELNEITDNLDEIDNSRIIQHKNFKK